MCASGINNNNHNNNHTGNNNNNNNHNNNNHTGNNNNNNNNHNNEDPLIPRNAAPAPQVIPAVLVPVPQPRENPRGQVQQVEAPVAGQRVDAELAENEDAFEDLFDDQEGPDSMAATIASMSTG